MAYYTEKLHKKSDKIYQIYLNKAFRALRDYRLFQL